MGGPYRSIPGTLVSRCCTSWQAAQCGYCTNGMIMAATALLRDTSHPTPEQAKQALGGNLCRCGTHTRIIAAIMSAAKA